MGTNLTRGQERPHRDNRGNPGEEKRKVMEFYRNLLNRIVREEEGQDLIEYALICGFISVVCYLAVQATGVAVSDIWGVVETAVEAAAAAI
jgi:Flp pilus assembly pilin Flp